MGFFRASSNSDTTATIPASTTLSARTLLYRYPKLTLASALACVGVFAFAVADGSPQTAMPSHGAAPASENVLTFTADPEPSAASEPAAESSIESTIETNVSVTNNGGSAPTANVTINGEQVPVPQNGTVTQISSDGNTQTTLQVDSTNQGTTTNSSFTSVNLNVNSSTNIEEDSGP